MPEGNNTVRKCPSMRVGMGYDIHRMVPGRRLLLGGVAIEAPAGLEGHSDADVVFHATADALLGAAALGDIGEHFPDTDPEWKGADSALMLRKVLELIAEHGYVVQNIDINIIAQQPRLGSKKTLIKENIARVLGLDLAGVGVKAKTKEQLGPVGAGEAIEATAVVLIALA